MGALGDILGREKGYREMVSLGVPEMRDLFWGERCLQVKDDSTCV